MLTNIWITELDGTEMAMSHTVKLEIENESPEELDRVLGEALDYLGGWAREMGEKLGEDFSSTQFVFENNPQYGIQAQSGCWYKPDGTWILGEEY